MNIIIGSDHGGFTLKEDLVKHLAGHDVETEDCGTFSGESVDYPDIAKTVCEKVLVRDNALGIVICGTGIGISIAANKIDGIRAALCQTEFAARMARQHNNANVLALGGRLLGNDLARAIVDAFIADRFSDEARHQRRIDKMMSFE